MKRTWVIAIAMLAGMVGVAGAAPTNDDISAAIVINTLPYSATGTTVGATAAAGDLSLCGDPARHTVWYRYTAARSGLLGALLTSSDYQNVLAVASGSPGALTPVTDCTARTVWPAVAGTTYYIEVGVDTGTGEPFTIRLQQTREARVAITVDPTGTVVRKTGLATISGTIACNPTISYKRGGWVSVGGELRQTSVRFTADNWIGKALANCAPTASRWTISGYSTTIRPFRIGAAFLDVTGDACNSFDLCGGQEVVTDIRLKATR